MDEGNPGAPRSLVSKAVWIAIDEPFSERVSLALKLIDEVHADGVLEELYIHDKPPLGWQIGDRAGYGWFPNEIFLAEKEEAVTPLLDICHEIGHWLDHRALVPPEKDDYAFRASETPEMEDWLCVARKSQAVKRLLMWSGKVPTSDYFTYLLKPREIWARAYAQYVAAKTQDEGLLREMEKAWERGPNEQWTWEDFSPILKKIDEAFKKREWLL